MDEVKPDATSRPAPDAEDAVRVAEIAHREARRVKSELDSEIHAAKNAAERLVDEQYRERISAARTAVNEAARALAEAENQRPAHPWTGKRVFRMEPVGRSWSRGPDKRLEGVVETRRIDTKFADNVSRYRLPDIGAAFVRLLKADGTPGLKFEGMSGSRGRPWQLAESNQEGERDGSSPPPIGGAEG